MANILVIGDLMLDIATTVRNYQTYEGAAASYTGERWRYLPGGAANVAAIVTGMGHSAGNCGCVAADWAGWELYKHLPLDSWLAWGATSTTIKFRAYHEGSVAVRVDREVPESLRCIFPPDVSKYDAVIFSDYYKGVFGPDVDSRRIRSIINSGIPTVVDPHVRGRNGLWKDALVATPNEREHDAIGPIGTKWTAVTMGHAGANLFQGETFRSSHPPIKGVTYPQVVGAGDAFTAALAVQLAASPYVPDAVDAAVAFATDYVSHPRT